MSIWLHRRRSDSHRRIPVELELPRRAKSARPCWPGLAHAERLTVTGKGPGNPVAANDIELNKSKIDGSKRPSQEPIKGDGSLRARRRSPDLDGLALIGLSILGAIVPPWSFGWPDRCSIGTQPFDSALVRPIIILRSSRGRRRHAWRILSRRRRREDRAGDDQTVAEDSDAPG
jgi:hypothetical protein